MSSLTHVLVTSRWKVSVVSAFTCLSVSMLMAVAKVAIRGGFGGSDLLPFFVWTIPLSVLIGLTKNGLVVLLRVKSLALAWALSGFVGVAIGVLWTLVVAFLVGPYFGAFSFEVVTCWIVGSVSGLVITWNNGTSQPLLISVAIILLIGFGALATEQPLLNRLANSREIEVITVKWTPGPQPLSNPPILGLKLSDSDLERLKSIGLTGQVEFASSGVFGKGKRGKAIIVMSEQLKQPTTLSQPDGSEVIYLQTPAGWKMYPPEAAMLKRSIQLWPDEREPERVTRYAVENADGSRQGGTLVTW